MPNWNEWFAERKTAQDVEKAEALASARATAQVTEKEPFDATPFRAIYAELNAHRIDQYTAWDTLLTESEYAYYVTYPDLKTLRDFAEYQKMLQDWG